MPDMSTVSAHRRPLVTAAAAAGVLVGLWFVPSASASPEPRSDVRITGAADRSAHGPRQGSGADSARGAAPDAAQGPEHNALTRLRDTGDSVGTPYLLGGAGLLSVGGVVAVRAVRRERRATPA